MPKLTGPCSLYAKGNTGHLAILEVQSVRIQNLHYYSTNAHAEYKFGNIGLCSGGAALNFDYKSKGSDRKID